MSGRYRGSTISMVSFSIVQPRPNFHGSRCTLDRPYDASRSRVHSTARLCAGEAVSRGPMSTVSIWKTGATCECSSPSVRILSRTSRSDGDCALGVAIRRTATPAMMILVMADGSWLMAMVHGRSQTFTAQANGCGQILPRFHAVPEGSLRNPRGAVREQTDDMASRIISVRTFEFAC